MSKQKIALFIALGALIISLIIICFPTRLLTLKSKKETKQAVQEPAYIDCYINGAKVRAAEKDCRELSKKKEPTIIQQPAPQPVPQPAPRAPVKIEAPECTTCDFDYMGRLVCRTKRSYFCPL